MAERKSQAALEFIMTYGWAILVVLVAIAALAYFGVLDPGRFLPAKCTLQSGIACLDHKATATTVEVYIQNSLGFDVIVDRVTASQCTALGSQGQLSNGGTGRYTFTTCTNLGSKYSGQLNITYTVIDSQVQHINQGQITTRLE